MNTTGKQPSRTVQEQVTSRFQGLVEKYGLPEPDEIRETDTEVRFLWNDQKVMVCIDLLDALPTNPE